MTGPPSSASPGDSSRVFESVGLGWGLRICLCNGYSGAGDILGAARLGRVSALGISSRKRFHFKQSRNRAVNPITGYTKGI